MEITLDKHAANQASVKIKLIEADYQPKVDAKIKDYAKKANIRGFRPGKAPIAMVKRMYGTSVLAEEINDMLSSSLNNFIKEQTFKVVGDPLPVEDESSKIDWNSQKDFEFEFKIGFVENIQFTLGKSFDLTTYKINLDEKEVDNAIENMRNQYGKMTNPEVSEKDDFLYGDLKANDGSFEKSFSLPLSKVQAEHVDQFIGLKKEDSIQIDPKLVLGDELATALDISEEEAENLSGEFTFTVINVNRTSPADIDQEFFDKLFGPGKVTTEEEMRAKVREILSESYDKELKVYAEEKAKDKMLEAANIELPEEFLKEWLMKANEGKITTEQLESEFPIYVKQLKWTLISDKIAKENEIRAEHADVIENTKELLRNQFASYGMTRQLEDSMDYFVDNYLKGNDGQNYMRMLNAAQNDKVLDYVMEQANTTEQSVDVEKFKELMEN